MVHKIALPNRDGIYLMTFLIEIIKTWTIIVVLVIQFWILIVIVMK